MEIEGANEFINKELEELIKSKHVYAMGTEFCHEHKKKHGNCVGCESQLGCKKMLTIKLASLTAAGYQPKDYSDYQTMVEAQYKQFEAIMEASTIEELAAIRLI